MEQNQQQLNVKVDPSQTVAITSPEGNHIFAEGVILRKLSKFVAGTAEDAIIPVPVMYDVKTGKVLVELLPKELRDEYANI